MNAKIMMGNIELEELLEKHLGIVFPEKTRKAVLTFTYRDRYLECDSEVCDNYRESLNHLDPKEAIETLRNDLGLDIPKRSGKVVITVAPCGGSSLVCDIAMLTLKGK